MKPKHKRLTFVALAMVAAGAATALALTALGDGVAYFYGPGDLAEKHIGPERRLRIGGMVEVGSLVKEGTTVRFVVADNRARLPVTYTGVLPDLFAEGQGVVAEGHLTPAGTFAAREILAKHDENYTPREVVDALKKTGHWGDEYRKQ